MKRAGLLLAAAALASCTTEGTPPTGLSSFRITIDQVNGGELPATNAPLPANRGETTDAWSFTIEARDALGEPVAFEGMVRVSVEPGAVVSVEGDGAAGRNILLRGGKAAGVANVTAVYGPARMWVEDLGYRPAAFGETPGCANGENDDPDEDVLIDFPTDPGCAFSDDDSEELGTFAAGISPPVAYSLPRVSDIQGSSATTPYPYEGIQAATDAPAHVIVTRVAKDGFYVTDVADPGGYNSIFAFNFSTPSRMRVCDRVTYLAGTVNEFFGFTELSFPSFKLEYPIEGEACEVPEPTIFDAAAFNPTKRTPYDTEAEKVESGLVRVVDFTIAKNFGPLPAVNNVFGPGSSSCDLNGDGQVDFESEVEASCGNACSDDPECSEWTGFSARGNFKVHDAAGNMIQLQTGAAPGFDPSAHKGETLPSVTGVLRNFSGGTLNWTIEVRCQDDLVCEADGCCPADRCVGGLPLGSQEACVSLRTIDDNDIVSD